MITISLNGQSTQLPEATRLGDALVQWEFHNTKVAVAINGEFVPRSSYQHHLLHNGDCVDVVRPVGGG